MKKKSKVAKVLALCLAMVMILSMSMTAFAVTSDDTASFEVTGFDTNPAPTVSAYQIITVNIDDNSEQPEYPMYTWADAVAGWVTEHHPNYIDNNLGENAVSNAFANADGVDMTTFLEEMAAAIKGGTEIIGFVPTREVVASNGTALFENMAMGEYLITANGGVKIYQPTTIEVVPEYANGTWTVSDQTGDNAVPVKSVTPGIPEKDASTEDNDKTVAIGDTVTYTLTVTVPSYPEDAVFTKFEVSDELDSGLAFDGNGTIHVYSDEALENEISNDNYTVTNPQGKTFLISFNSAFTTTYENPTLYITYTATVNENAFGEDALGNDAFLGYNNDPYTDSDYTTPGTHEDVYTYGIQFDKVDKDGGALSGAEFTLSDAGGTVLTFTETSEDSGIYNYDPDSTNTTLTVSQGGSLQIQGLDVGTYTLKETKAPDNYVLPTGAITIVLTDAGEDGSLDATSSATADGTSAIYGTVSVDDNDTNKITFDVQNTSSEDAGFNLPQTGGMGTMIFTIAGIILMAGAITMVVVISRKKRA